MSRHECKATLGWFDKAGNTMQVTDNAMQFSVLILILVLVLGDYRHSYSLPFKRPSKIKKKERKKSKTPPTR